MNEARASLMAILILGSIMFVLLSVEVVLLHVFLGKEVTTKSFLKYFMIMAAFCVFYYLVDQCIKNIIQSLRG